MKSHESDNIFFVEHNATFRHLRNILNKNGVHLKDGGKRQVIKNLEIGATYRWFQKSWSETEGS